MLISLDNSSSVPLYQQIMDQIKDRILIGALGPAAIPGMLVMKSAETTGAVIEQIGGIVEFTQTPAGVLSATALGLLAMAVSWALSTRIFVKRDIGQMP